MSRSEIGYFFTIDFSGDYMGSSYMERSKSIYDRTQRVLERIDHAAKSVGRDSKDVKLVVVTKGHPLDAVQKVLESGIRVVGENYAEEGASKKLACAQWPDVEWHMIGHIQSRKARLVAEHFQWVHSLDSLKLARRLDRFADQYNRRLPVLIECNISGEQSKFGWEAWEQERWPELLPDLEQVIALPNLDLRGLMTMAPFLQNPELARPYFQRLRRLRDFLEDKFPRVKWEQLSMGMSDDFEVAVQEGATLVRVGTAIMGKRKN